MRGLPVALAIAALIGPGPGLAGQAQDWRTDWEVQEGFSLQQDTRGFSMPTAIAFVANPGPGPNDPLYFVTELRGTLKVVTNDRTVHTFAEGFARADPLEELPSGLGEHGTAGICLDDARGYVFVTFVYSDSTNLRNDVIRFDTEPGRFAIAPTGQRKFTQIFAADRSYNSHQIGGCQVEGGLLYVSVADGLQAVSARYLQSTLGKVLRMTVDGDPAPGNPFADGGEVTPSDYVWAYGFRNPFGLESVDGRWFVAENGMNIDRFVEVQEGGDYLWDGDDWSIGARAAMVWGPSVSPVQTQFYPQGSDLFPEAYHNRFYIATAGLSDKAGPGLAGEKSVLMLEYDFDRRAMASRPTQLMRYRGAGYQIVTGLAFGPDGLYVAPILPDVSGESAILHVAYDPENEHPYVIGRTSDASVLIAQKRCLGCHRLGEQGGQAGPDLNYGALISRLTERLNSPGYVDSLAQLDTLETEPFISTADRRQAVAAAEGNDRLRAWLTSRIMEPRFDMPGAQMPNLGVSQSEAALIADYLMTPPPEVAEPGLVGRAIAAIKRRVPPSRHRYTVFAFVAGLGVMLAAVSLRRRTG